jgi:hypothetical protein
MQRTVRFFAFLNKRGQVVRRRTMTRIREWRLFFRLSADGPRPVVPPSAPPRYSFREGDTFAPARILAMDEPLAALYGTSQALACCALAKPESDLSPRR